MNSKRKDSIAVLFSGGSDSTLAAVLAAQKSDRVYLLSYSHRLMYFHQKITMNIRRLKEHFPSTQFIHLTDDIDVLFKRIYFNRVLSYVRRYRTMLIPWICGACSLSMHMKTLEFCRKHSIGFVYCGANKESSGIVPSQIGGIISDIRAVYRKYDISYEAPVYGVDRADHVLHKIGIVKNRNLKDQHLIYSTQHSCPLGVLLHVHSRLYYSRIWGNNKYKEKSREMMRLTIREATGFLLGEASHEYSWSE